MNKILVNVILYLCLFLVVFQVTVLPNHLVSPDNRHRNNNSFNGKNSKKVCYLFSHFIITTII